jgi:hypothetical protein
MTSAIVSSDNSDFGTWIIPRYCSRLSNIFSLKAAIHTTSYSSPVFEFMQEYRLHESLYVAVDRSLSNYEDSHLYNNDVAVEKE